MKYCIRLVERLDRNGPFLAPPHLLSELDAEYANIRSALARAISSADAQSALHLVAVLADYWWFRSLFAEGRYWATKALSMGESESLRSRAAAARTLGLCLAELGDVASARQTYENAVAWYRQTDDAEGLAWSLMELGAVLITMGSERANMHLNEAMALFEARGITQGIAFVYNSLGDLKRAKGKLSDAVSCYEASLANWEKVSGGSFRPVRVLLNLGIALIDVRAYERARKILLEGLENALRWKRGPSWMLEGLTGVALALAHTGEPEKAVLILAAVKRHATELSLRLAFQSEYRETLAALQSRLSSEAFQTAVSKGMAMSVDECVALLDSGGSEKGDAGGSPSPDHRVHHDDPVPDNTRP